MSFFLLNAIGLMCLVLLQFVWFASLSAYFAVAAAAAQVDIVTAREIVTTGILVKSMFRRTARNLGPEFHLREDLSARYLPSSSRDPTAEVSCSQQSAF